MFSSLWIVALVIVVGAWILYLLEEGRSTGSALDYRRKYDRMIDRLEGLVQLANRLEPAAKASTQVSILDSYLGHLRMLETLMEALHKLPTFSTQAASLKAPQFLIDDLTVRFQRLSSDIDDAFGGRRKTRRAKDAPLLGCYFCSKPFDALSFQKVRVKVDGSAEDVAACKVCYSKLVSGKKAKVLFLSENGQTVHWSKAKDYTPSEQFWSINDDSASDQKTLSTGNHLTLVYSSITPLSSQSRLDS